MDKTDRLRDYGLAFLLYEHGLGVCGYELIRELFIFIKLILYSYLQPYIKKELALLYFPSTNPHVAVNLQMMWIKHCPELHHELVEQGYKKNAKWLLPREVVLNRMIDVFR